MALTLAEANRIIQAAITKAQEMNIKVSAAVCDAGGRLMAFNRMDGAIWGSVYGSQGKAIASAAFGRASVCSPLKWLTSESRCGGASTVMSASAHAASDPHAPGQISPLPMALAPMAAGKAPGTARMEASSASSPMAA